MNEHILKETPPEETKSEECVLEVAGDEVEEYDGRSVFDVDEDEEEQWRAPVRGGERVPLMEVGESVEVKDVLEKSAEMAQRLLVSGLRRTYTRGRSYIDSAVQQVPITGQRRVALTSFFNVIDYRADELIERLCAGRVVARMSAAPGVGKTTRICGEIATRCGLRVCQLELNAHVSSAASQRIRSSYNLNGSNRRFPRDPGPYLTCMTYDDFRGYVCSASRKRLFADFDVFFFDEAHTPSSSVFLALQYFAVYAQKHNSLIVASATVSTDESNNVASKRVGEFKNVDLDFRKAVESGKLFNEYLRDKTQVLLPSDSEVWYAKAVYAEQGIDVVSLDSASTELDEKNAREWLTGEALTPRVVVCLYDYGLGYNLPVGYVITTASKMVYDWTKDGALREEVLPLTEKDVVQQKSRTGRGLAVGSGGLVLSTSRSADVELEHSERIRAYIGLIAGSIKPLESQWADVSPLFPQGLTRDVAMRILSVPLPPMLVARYLGSDGNVSAFFAQAMTVFAEPDHFIVPSVDVYPVGFESWSSESYGGYFEGDESMCNVEVRVPFTGCPSLKVYMHALYAIATRRIGVLRWRPDTMDEDVSGSEDEAPRFKPASRVVLPRLVVDVHKPPSPILPVERRWAFDVPLEQQAKRKRRVARDWAGSPNGQIAIAELCRAIEGTSTVGVVTANIRTDEDSRQVEVRSPGGSVTVKLSSSLYRQLAAGVVIDPSLFVALLNVVKLRHNKLVESGLFSNWGPPWTSVLLSCMEPSVIDEVVENGLIDVMSLFIKKLYDRFRSEVIEVCKTSHVYGTWIERFLSKKPSLTRLVKEVRSGKLSIAQSDTFIKRVLEIKELHDRAVMGFERHGFYLPDRVTEAQRRLPLRDRTRRLSVIDGDVQEQPSKISYGHTRGFSR